MVNTSNLSLLFALKGSSRMKTTTQYEAEITVPSNVKIKKWSIRNIVKKTV